MFFETNASDRPLPYDPFKAIVSPRPIGWITSMNAQGDVNLAPYSFFNAVASKPNLVMFSSERRKDSLAFVEETKEFVCNLATWDLRDAMNFTSGAFPRGVNEMEAAGLTAAPSRLVRPPRVAESPCALECRLLKVVDLQDISGSAVDAFVTFGQVVGIYIDDAFIKDGLVDTAAMKPIARCGYRDYAVVTEMFQMIRPSLAR